MISITVKTLDSQNHHFTVEESLTVEQFKNHIAEQVNVPAARQRIIYCGRVLQDGSTLADYNVDGKVVHLVQRAPPSATNRNVRSLTPPPDLNRARGGFRGFERGNSVYMGMGSMTFPHDLIDPQQMIPPRATHTLSSSRLNVARRMLRHAENVVRLLENPNGTETGSPPNDEATEEEMTPIIEARVIVPGSNEMLDGNALLNVVQQTIFSSEGGASSNERPASTSAPETPRSSSTENLASDTQGEAQRPDNSRRSRIRCRGTSELATLLQTLNQLQVRFAPFLARYEIFMQNDPLVPPEELQETRDTLNRVSQVLHYLGHAYHSLSDILVNVSQRPPRLLLCHPILIQPQAVVQTGIPIQVEAQINLSTDRPAPPPTGAAAPPAGAPPTTESNTSSGTAPIPPPQPAGAQPPPLVPLPGLPMRFLGMPFVQGGSTPVEIRTIRLNNLRRRPNDQAATAQPVPQTTAPPPPPPPPPPATDFPVPPPSANAPFGQDNGGNLEFFMELPPDAVHGRNFIDSLMRFVGSQLGDTINQQVQQNQQQRAEGGGGVNGQSTHSNAQQSQARSTQTNPTTATHTRSTPRPHVHMTQQTVQGGFDPFLHCFSHHIRPSRADLRAGVTATRSRQEETTSGTGTPPPPPRNSRGGAAHDPPIRLGSIIQDLLRNSIPVPQPEVAPQQGPNSSQSATDIMSLLSRLLSGQNVPDLLGNVPTLDVYLQNFGQELYVEGDSLLMDFIMLMLQNLRIPDIFAISMGNMEPLQRQTDAIRGFFLRTVCQNDASDAGVSRATERVIADFSPMITALESVRTRDNIRMGDTVRAFFRQRVPEIIRLAIRDPSASLAEGEAAPSNLLTTLWTAAREFLALAVHCSANGLEGVLTAFQQVLISTFNNPPDMPNNLQQWSIDNSLVALRNILRDFPVNTAAMESLVVRDPLVTPWRVESMQQEPAEVAEEVESMDVDYATTSSPILNANVGNQENHTHNLVEDDAVAAGPTVWAPWHNQTPAEWVPIITRDIEKQRAQTIQTHFSDAYISGMPSKRRKLIRDRKPHGNYSQAISDTVREAVTSTGLAQVAPLEVVVEAAAQSAEVQTAYRNLFEATVYTNMRDDGDFDPDRYPNAARYFTESPPE